MATLGVNDAIMEFEFPIELGVGTIDPGQAKKLRIVFFVITFSLFQCY